MFITKKSLPRRTFLRGMGAAVGLPLLDAMVPAATALAQTAAKAPKRAGFVYVPNGVILESWVPATAGSGFEFSPTLKPLEPYRNQVTVVSRMDRPGDDPDHALASAGWLSNVTAKETEGQDFLAGTTVDQIIARQIGKDSPILSIEVATEDFTGYVGGCSPGYACAYVNTLSWSTPTTPLPMEINPRVVFERMFGRAGTSAQRLARLKANRGVLDSVAEAREPLGAVDDDRVDDLSDRCLECLHGRFHVSERELEVGDLLRLQPAPDLPLGRHLVGAVAPAPDQVEERRRELVRAGRLLLAQQRGHERRLSVGRRLLLVLTVVGRLPLPPVDEPDERRQRRRRTKPQEQ